MICSVTAPAPGDLLGPPAFFLPAKRSAGVPGDAGTVSRLLHLQVDLTWNLMLLAASLLALLAGIVSEWTYPWWSH